MPIGDFLSSRYSIYYGTQSDTARSFELKHKDYPIFKKFFNANDPSVVSIASSTIKIENHFFVTGEKVIYSSGDSTNSPIEIESTNFGAGIGITNKLPSLVHIIKIDENTIKLARSAEDALKSIPISLSLTSVGIGSNHSFTSTNQNSKLLVALDNVIQSPIVSTSTTTLLSSDFTINDNILYCDTITDIFAGDHIKINNEIMKVQAIGLGVSSSIRVIRPWAGTEIENHSIGSTITKINGNYNITENTINFLNAPYGNVPLSSTTNSSDDIDWESISTRSSFQGRVFMRSGITDTINDAYYKNYIFDDISSELNGIDKSFILTSNKSDITNISDENGIILINNIFQEPGSKNNYTMDEVSGKTSISFVGSATSIKSDINTSDFPSGGILVSIGSSPGFGYQPLISAGGKANVSIAGTISSISIGNSGSGYRSQIQTATGTHPITVRVGVATTSSLNSKVEFIGQANILKGNITSVTITNPGSGYQFSNPPYVIIDPPISYSNIPLIYSSGSSGVGTEATVDIVVGQGSSIISYEIKNFGYGYKVGETLTIPRGGTVGIPTILNSDFNEFKITVDRIFVDKFSGWSLGKLQSLDNIQNLFDGKRVNFPLKYLGDTISILAEKGSPIEVQDVLLVFINDILQVPGEGYIFKGGSKITFSEPPKPEDKCKIIFYKGSGDDVDVIFRDIVETVKIGDDLTLNYDSSIGQPTYLQEDLRFVTDILSFSIDSVKTNPYFGPGNTTDENLLRPIIWCKQTNDLIIDGKFIPKDRSLYEPQIYPSAYLIQPVGIGSTIIFVDNIAPFFNPKNENDGLLEFQNNITIISQDSKISAAATALVSTAGTISSIVINNGGFGYQSAPDVSIQTPLGISTITSTAISSITSGIVTSITLTGIATGYSKENPPSILIEPPIVDKEVNKVVSYTGDSGVILGIGNTYNGSNYQLIFDLYIPEDSFLKDPLLVESPIGISSLSVGDFFMVYDTNVGLATTSFNCLGLNNNIISTCNKFVDSVYQVQNKQLTQVNITSLETVNILRVFANVSSGLAITTPSCDYSSVLGFDSTTRTFDSTLKTFDSSLSICSYDNDLTFDSNNVKFDNNSYTFDNNALNTNCIPLCILSTFGKYSWGKINLKSRSKNINFNSYTNEGIVGIITSSMVRRTTPLKYKNYAI